MIDVTDRNNNSSVVPDAEPASLRDEMSDLHARFCRGIGDPKRLMIIASLKHGEQTVGQLAHQIGATHSNTSQHLSIMRDLGLLHARRVDNNVFYRLSDPRLADVVDLLRAIQTDPRRHPTPPQPLDSSRSPRPLDGMAGTGEQP